MGKAAAQVYEVICAAPRTLAELVQLTGRDKKTIRKNLKLMERMVDPLTGELIPMAEAVNGRWRGVPVDLARVAQVVGTAGALRKQKGQHGRERLAHRMTLNHLRGQG